MTELTLLKRTPHWLFNPTSSESVTARPSRRSEGDNVEYQWVMHIHIPVVTGQGNELVTEEAGWAAKVRKNLAKWMEENPY